METRSSTEVLDVEASPFAAEDYVQMACSLRRSAEMRVRYPDGKSGGIIVNKGELWHAWDNLGEGNEAFLRMVGVARVTRIRSLIFSDTVTQTVVESCQQLLLQALIAHDASSVNARAVTSDPSEPYADSASDTELTRPDWPALRRDLISPTNPEAEAVTARSFTERPVAISAAPAVRPRSIATFLRQPTIVQRGVAALFGSILLGSVGQILASPAGGARSADQLAPQRVLASAQTFQPRSAQPTTVVKSRPSEVVFNVSSLPSVDWRPARVFTKVHNVTTSGPLDTTTVGRHVTSATAQFAACYDWAANRALTQSGLGNLAVVVNIDKFGSVVSASSRGGKLQGLNTCVAQLAERLGTLLKAGVGPSRLAWTVSYVEAEAATDRVDSEIH